MCAVRIYTLSLGALFYRMIRSCRVVKGFEEKFPHQNWPIVLGLVLFRQIAFLIITPSVYQFVTTQKHDICRDNESNSETELQSSDVTVYSWVFMVYYIFKMVSIPIAVIISEKIPYIMTILITLSAYMVSGVLYGTANTIWMVIVSRSLMGCGSAFIETLVLGYVGEMGTHMDVMRQQQSKHPRKYALYIAYSFAYNIAFTIAFGCTSIIVQFQSVDQYRWPGWFIAALAVVCAAVVIVAFREPRSFGELKSYAKCNYWRGLRLSLTFSPGWRIQLICYLFLGSCAYLFAQIYTTLITLVSPVLSDQFGFSVEYTSHFLVGQSAAFIVGSFLLLVAKCFKLNNWLLLGVSLVVILFGVIIMGDWQGIGHDPCVQDGNNITNEYMHMQGDESTDQCFNASLFQKLCEIRSNSNHECFWNQQSRITGKFCNTCNDFCLSKQKTMNFYQLCTGVLLISVMVPIGYFSIPAILSDITRVESQNRVQIVYIGGYTISSVLTPLWFVKSYESSGNHIYIPMAVTAVSLIILIISLLVLYKILAPESIQTEVSDLSHHASINVSATLAILFGLNTESVVLLAIVIHMPFLYADVHGA